MTITQLISPPTVGNDAGDDVVGEGDSVAAYTELVLRDPSDVRAIQYDTVVAPAHRGHGLGSAVKRHMLGTVSALHPGVREIATTVADDSGPMPAVNERLGYRRERPTGVFRARLYAFRRSLRRAQRRPARSAS